MQDNINLNYRARVTTILHNKNNLPPMIVQCLLKIWPQTLCLSRCPNLCEEFKIHDYETLANAHVKVYLIVVTYTVHLIPQLSRERVLAVTLTFSLGPAQLTTAMENLYSLNGIKPIMVVMFMLPSTRLNGAPIAGKISTSMAVMGVISNPRSQERDTSLSPMLVTVRFIGAGQAKMNHVVVINNRLSMILTILSLLISHTQSATSFNYRMLDIPTLKSCNVPESRN